MASIVLMQTLQLIGLGRFDSKLVVQLAKEGNRPAASCTSLPVNRNASFVGAFLCYAW